MKAWSRSNILAAVLVLASFILVVSYIFVPMWWLQWRAARLPGAPEAEVLAVFGAPYRTLTAAEIAALPPKEAWWFGDSWFPAPAHPVTGKVLLYYKGAAGVIIYIDTKGAVEHVANIGT